ILSFTNMVHTALLPPFEYIQFPLNADVGIVSLRVSSFLVPRKEHHEQFAIANIPSPVSGSTEDAFQPTRPLNSEGVPTSSHTLSSSCRTTRRLLLLRRLVRTRTMTRLLVISRKPNADMLSMTSSTTLMRGRGTSMPVKKPRRVAANIQARSKICFYTWSPDNAPIRVSRQSIPLHAVMANDGALEQNGVCFLQG